MNRLTKTDAAGNLYIDNSENNAAERLALQDLAEISMCDSCLYEAEDDCNPNGDIKGCLWRWRYEDRLLLLGGDDE